MSSNNQENSVLFSLNELMNIERDRLDQEERAAKAQVEQARVRAAEQKAIALRLEQDRIAAAERAQTEELSRRREQDERRAQERQEAELRVRLESAAKTQAAQQAQQFAHERQIATIEATQTKSKSTGIFAGVAALMVVAMGVGGLFVQRDWARQEQARSQSAAREVSAIQERANQQAAIVRAQTQQALDRANEAAQRAAALQQQTQNLLNQHVPARVPTSTPTVRRNTQHHNTHQQQLNQIDPGGPDTFIGLGN